jgi:beta-lactamase class A
MRKLLTVIIYTFIILVIGRNLSMLPKFYIFSSVKEEQDTFTNNLKNETQKLIKNSPGSYGIYFADFNKPHTFGINHKEIFTGASVNKVQIISVLYYLDNKNKIDLDEKITLQKDDIQDYGTGTLRYQKPGGIYSLKTLAKLAIKQSDNTAAHILGDKIGIPLIQKTIEEWGLTQTDMENNKTSAYDMYILFRKIYKGEITSVAKTQELFGFMIDTDIEDRLPALLPDSVNIYHKTGDAVGGMHDVGIIQKDGTVFFLGVLTSDIGNNETKTKENIAKMAKTILDQYGKKE